MFSTDKKVVSLKGRPYTKRILLADVNIPYKFSLDRCKNKLFFCINGDEFSDQSFQSVKLDLDTGAATTIPSIRNGFASAVDNATGTVYLGGSDGVYRYNYDANDIIKPVIIKGIDVFDMFYKTDLYYVDTTNLDLHIYKDNADSIVTSVEEYGIHQFAIDASDRLIFVNPTGLFVLDKGSKSPSRLCNNVDNIRCITTDTDGSPYLISQNGIYSINIDNKEISKILSLDNGYALAFDNDNNIIYSEERPAARSVPAE